MSKLDNSSIVRRIPHRRDALQGHDQAHDRVCPISSVTPRRHLEATNNGLVCVSDAERASHRRFLVPVGIHLGGHGWQALAAIPGGISTGSDGARVGITWAAQRRRHEEGGAGLHFMERDSRSRL